MFSRKSYKTIAQIICRLTRGPAWGGTEFIKVDELMDALSDYFEADNPSFNRDKFVAVCCGEVV